MLREVAEGGAHLDRETLATLAAVPHAVSAIIADGISRKAFRPVHPLAAYFTMLAPLVGITLARLFAKSWRLNISWTAARSLPTRSSGTCRRRCGGRWRLTPRPLEDRGRIVPRASSSRVASREDSSARIP